MKNSDIKNFEKHLNNYLNFIRKYNKDIQYFHKNNQNNPVIYEQEEDFLSRNGNGNINLKSK